MKAMTINVQLVRLLENTAFDRCIGVRSGVEGRALGGCEARKRKNARKLEREMKRWGEESF